MALTRKRLESHVKHALLGGNPAAELSASEIINDAGRWFYSAHKWRFAARPPVDIAFEAGVPYARLPRDFGQMIYLRDNNSTVTLTTPEELGKAELLGSVNTGTTSAYRASIVYPEVFDSPADPDREWEPRLQLVPTPSGTDAQALRLWYRAGWRHMGSERDTANVPRFAESALIVAVRAFAVGYEQDDLDERLIRAEAGPAMIAAKRYDGAIQSKYGRLSGGGAWATAAAEEPNWLALEVASDPA